MILHIHEPRLRERVLSCAYTVDKEHFENTYEFPEEPQQSDTLLALQLLRWVAIVSSFGLFSISYFEKIVCDFPLTADDTAFFEKLFFHGFGEFRLTNNIDVSKRVSLVGSKGTTTHIANHKAKTQNSFKPLLLNGGGKDGSVSSYLLDKANIDFTWYQRGNSAAQANIVSAWGKPVLQVQRRLDPKRLNRMYTGHRPMSAGIAFLAILSAYIFGYTDIIASNESSANEGNIELNGVMVNHQYSKSFEFEQDLQKLLRNSNVPVHYFSLLRPLNELQISMILPHLSDTQLQAITSCNHGTQDATWCLNCAKCAFIVLVVTAANPNMAKTIWGNESIINAPGLHTYLSQLLDPAATKPLECVGTLDECQLAAYHILHHLRLSLSKSTQELLAKYAYMRDVSKDVGLLTSLGPHAIPKDYQAVLPLLKTLLSNS